MDLVRKILLITAFFIALAAVGGLYTLLIKNQKGSIEPRRLHIGNNSFQVETAENSISQAKGLSGRESLAEDQGMIFIFTGLATRTFWMSGMKFPLDIIWIKEGRIAGISKDLPPATLTNITVYESPEPVDMVLEINAGLSDKFGIKIGDVIKLD